MTEIRCEWMDYYPYESCPTRILNMFTDERMDRTIKQDASTHDNRKSREMTTEQKRAKRLYDSKRIVLGKINKKRESQNELFS